MSDLGALHRKYDGPIPARKDPAQVQRSALADLQRLRDSAAVALLGLDTAWSDAEDVLRLRETIAWYDRQIERVQLGVR